MFTLQIDFATDHTPFATVFEDGEEYCAIKLDTLSMIDLVRLAWMVKQGDRQGISDFWSKS